MKYNKYVVRMGLKVKGLSQYEPFTAEVELHAVSEDALTSKDFQAAQTDCALQLQKAILHGLNELCGTDAKLGYLEDKSENN